MNSDFFVRLTLATHKVADILPQQDVLAVQMKDSANKLLGVLILLTQENPVSKEQKQGALPKAIRELGVLIAYLNYAKRTTQVSPENFLVLEREYNELGNFLRQLHQNIGAAESEIHPAPQRQIHGLSDILRAGSSAGLRKDPESVPNHAQSKASNTLAAESTRQNRAVPTVSKEVSQEELSPRQGRILELMRNKPKVQVWELQKVLPEVTKRTLRRDLDNLLQRSLIIRQGEWNEVFYQIR